MFLSKQTPLDTRACVYFGVKGNLGQNQCTSTHFLEDCLQVAVDQLLLKKTQMLIFRTRPLDLHLFLDFL